MPFGLANAPSTFQRMMDRIFRDLPFVRVYLDDLAIATQGTAEDHMRHIQTVLDRLRANQLKLNPAKCHFFATHVRYLGHIVGSGAIRADADSA